MDFFKPIDPDNPGKFLYETVRILEREFEVVITIHDCRGLLYDLSGEHIFEENRRHTHPFCRHQRNSQPYWNTYCNRYCLFEAESLAREHDMPFLHRCWKGGYELIVPVSKNGSLLMLIYAGVFRAPGEEAPELLTDSAKKEFRALKILNRERLESLNHLLCCFGKSVLYCTSSLRQERDRQLVSYRRHEIRQFLADHVHEGIQLEDLASALNLSASRTSHLVKKLFTVPFRTLLEDERMTRAKNMLLHTEFPLKTIAEAVGFRNVFYFNQVFRRRCGTPPGRFRRENGK